MVLVIGDEVKHLETAVAVKAVVATVVVAEVVHEVKD